MLDDIHSEKRTLKRFIKSLLCKHEYKFIRRASGDENNSTLPYRSWVKCAKCGRIGLDD